ncbi:hypothetical protein HED60_19010 [Planctomycetales bacterium ZRK34]|nr:hypothetical protein HED60_19010 [Planctomycetales bacterium ZRK34]
MRMNRLIGSLLAVCIVLAVVPAWAWHHEGHQRLARVAIASLPADVPAFLREAGAVAANVSVDPDLVRAPTLPQIRDAEGPDHYIDLEILQGRPLPPLRSQYIRMIGELDVVPAHAGFVPYAVAEWTQRLTMALAEYRHWPDDPAIQMKVKIYAGLLTHYSSDLVQPLHTTIHHDGRAVEGRSPHSGIHSKVDDLLYRFTDEQVALPESTKLEVYDDVFAAAVGELMKSHALVDRTYELEKQLPGVKEDVPLTPEVKAFALDRARHGVRFTASLIYTAWVKSEAIKMPAWFKR